MTDYRIADGEAEAAAAPRSFFIPSREERESLRPGDLAKLLFELIDPQAGQPGGERMWVEVVSSADGRYTGVLANVPSAITTITAGDPVEFGPEHVISTLESWPLLEKKMFVSRRSQVDDVRPSYVYREDPDNEQDSGWRALVGDESVQEVDDPSNVLLQDLGYLLDRWPELRPVFKTDPVNAEWVWDAPASQYVQMPSDRAE